MQEARSLDEQRAEFARRRLIATPIAGMIAWTVIGDSSLFLNPFAISWIIRHWIGLVHGIIRTVAVLLVWYLFPEHRFLAVPAVIVLLYVFAISVLENRWRRLSQKA